MYTSLKQLINTEYCDFIFLQQTNIQDDYTRDSVLFELGLTVGIFSYSTYFNNGTAIIQTSNRGKVTFMGTGLDNRLTYMKITDINFSSTFTLFNIYAPASSNLDRPRFFEHLEKFITDTDRHTCVVGGDFNITLDEIDITGRKGIQRVGRRELQHLVNSHKLTDCYRKIFPDEIVTTHTNTDNKRASRLDRIYVTDKVNIQSAKHLSCTLKFTDHKALHVVLGHTI